MSTVPGPTKTILVVEDERIVAKDLQQNLIALGYRVPSLASSADEAIRFAAEHCPDLVLMDVRLAGERDGIEAAEVFRSRFEVPVVYLTAFADEATLLRAKKTEPYGYLLKPVRPEELRSTVEIALHKHEMERRRLARERHFAMTLRSIGDAVLSTDTEGCVAFMNPVAESLTGWHAADAIGRELGEVLQLRDAQSGDSIVNPIAAALESRRSLEVSGLLVAKNGQVRAIADSAAPILGERGEVLGGVLVFREAHAVQESSALGSDVGALGKSAAGLVHEINNPLTFVMANIQFALAELRAHEPELAGEAWVEEIDRALADAQGGADRVRRIVNLRHDRPSDDGHADVRRVIEWSLKLARHELGGRARIVTDFAVTPEVRADETRLGQVVLNLLVNAAHALPADRVRENEIRISTALEGGERVVIEVRDNGCGMSADVMKHIFEPFFTTKRDAQGKGLGLAICRGIVLSFGGDIAVRSTPGRGTSFRVSLPVDPTESTAESDVAERTPGSILIVDDEPMINESLRRMLVPPHRVTLAEDGPSALARIGAGERFDLVICDLMMSGMSGMDLHRELKKRDPDQARRMLFMTGGAFTAHAIEFLKTIDNPCMQKPLRPDELETTIARMLDGLGPAPAQKAS